MAEYLLIVALDRPQVYEYLRQVFSSDKPIQVLLDRRRGERRQRNEPHAPERRRGQRRSAAGRHPRSDWFVFVRPPAG